MAQEWDAGTLVLRGCGHTHSWSRRAPCRAWVSPGQDGGGACSLRTIRKRGPAPGSQARASPCGGVGGVQADSWAWHRGGARQVPAEDGPVTVRSAVWAGGCLAVLLRSCPRKEETPLAPRLRASSGKLPGPSHFPPAPLLRTKGFPHSEPWSCQAPYGFFFSRLNARLNSR